MAGNPSNAAVWGGADVLIAPIGTAIPVANAAFGAGWEHVGLLDGGQGFEETIETTSTDHTAWGYGVIAGTYVGDLKVRDNTTRVLVAFVTKSGGTERRLISKNYATIAATSAGTEGEESLGSKAFEATIVPDENKTVWYTYKGASL